MNKKYLFFINLSIGITLAIQALLHPTLESQTKNQLHHRCCCLHQLGDFYLVSVFGGYEGK